MSPRLGLFSFLMLAALAAPATAQLINGGAEGGSLSPWVPDLSGAPSGNASIIKAVGSQAQTEPPVFPSAGGWFFSFATQVAGPVGSFVSLSQVAPIAGSPAAVALTGRVQTEYGDFGSARLQLLDAGGNVVATEVLEPLVSNGVWSPFFVDVHRPASATHCRVTLTGTVQVGMAVNVFWDELVLGASPWTKVSTGLPGTHGVPVIDGAGPLQPGSLMTVTLTDARTHATAWLVIGAAAIYAPFKGGVMVPHPSVVLPLPTGPAGALTVPALWPAGVPSGFSTWFQWWVQDPAGPIGFAATRGLRGTTP